jgi:hypothetical protein
MSCNVHSYFVQVPLHVFTVVIIVECTITIVFFSTPSSLNHHNLSEMVNSYINPAFA